MAGNVFERREIKYVLTKSQAEGLIDRMSAFMEPDKHGVSTIKSAYYDTPSYQLIRDSLEKPKFKEKIRVRSYGDVSDDETVFVELKRKFKKTVYKRRVLMTNRDAKSFLAGDDSVLTKYCMQVIRGSRAELPEKSRDKLFVTNQMISEIRFFRNFYKRLIPAALICYDRRAFYGRDDAGFRMTFDTNIRARDFDVDLAKSPDGMLILDPGLVVLEVKTLTGLPRWLLDYMAENDIVKGTYSKYGTAYKEIIFPKTIFCRGREAVQSSPFMPARRIFMSTQSPAAHSSHRKEETWKTFSQA